MEQHNLSLMKWLGGAEKRFCLHWPSFIVAFAIGIFYVYISVPPRHRVVKHPTPFNAGHVTYTDDAGACFVYKAKKVDCPTNPTLVSEHPIVVSKEGENTE